MAKSGWIVWVVMWALIAGVPLTTSAQGEQERLTCAEVCAEHEEDCLARCGDEDGECVQACMDEGDECREDCAEEE